MAHEPEWQRIVRRIREEENASAAAHAARQAAAIELAEACMDYDPTAPWTHRRYSDAVKRYQAVRYVD